MKKLKFYLILVFTLIFTSCEKEEKNPCLTVDPHFPETTFTLVNNLGEPLIGENKLYDPNILRELNADSRFVFADQLDYLVYYYFDGLMSGEKTFFRLSESDIDTIAVFYERVETECFTSINLVEFRYNGELIDSEQDYLPVTRFDVVKQ